MAPAARARSVTIAVAIVSDNRLFELGLGELLRRDHDLHLHSGNYGNAEIAVVLIDGSMEGALTRCAELSRQAAVIVLGAGTGDEESVAALRAGARGVLEKEGGVVPLRRAIRAVAKGQVWAPSAAVTHALSLLSPPERAGAGPGTDGRLTPREKEIVRHALDGLSNKEIAGRMIISPATVKAHLTSVFRKLSVRDRTQLVIFYRSPATSAPWLNARLPTRRLFHA
jgi:DNA-binding NarL/FixJ family response regulator